MYISHYVIWNFDQNHLCFLLLLVAVVLILGIANLFKGGSKKHRIN